MKLISQTLLNKGMTCTFILAALLFFAPATQGQTSFSKQSLPSKSSTSKAKDQAGSKTSRPLPNLKTTRTIDSRQKGTTVLRYALLSVSENGYIMLDIGNGAEILKNSADKPFTSIIAALNQLVGMDKWRVVTSYDLTNENPFPSFLLNKHFSEG